MSVGEDRYREQAAADARGYLASLVIVPVLLAIYWIATFTKWQPVVVGMISIAILILIIARGLRNPVAIVLWVGWILIMGVLTLYYIASDSTMSDGIPIYAFGVMIWLIAIEGWSAVALGRYISRF